MLYSSFRQNHVQFNQPAVNTIETAESYILELALPGWSKDSVELRVDCELLVVKGALEHSKDTPYRRREFGITKFEKTFHLPDTIDLDGINATLEQGVLNITLPKVPAAQPVRKAIAIA